MWTNPFVPNNFDFAYQVPPDGILPLIASDARMGSACNPLLSIET